MQTRIQETTQRERSRIPFWLGVCLFVAIALFFLLEEHRAHIHGALPYVLVALCPIIHLFIHHGHSSNGTQHQHHASHTGNRQEEGGGS